MIGHQTSGTLMKRNLRYSYKTSVTLIKNENLRTFDFVLCYLTKMPYQKLDQIILFPITPDGWKSKSLILLTNVDQNGN